MVSRRFVPLVAVLRKFLPTVLAAGTLSVFGQPGLGQMQQHPQAPPRQPQQAPAPSPPPAQPSGSAEAVTTLRVAVRRVALDLTVTDAKGHPVPDMKASDFTVFEDKLAQPIRSFEPHSVQASAGVTLPPLPVNTFANLSSNATNGPATVILYDLLNTPQDSQAYAHAQMLDFLRKHRTGGQVAIFVLTDRLHMLQGFTDDDNKLIAALSQQQTKGYKSGLLQEPGEATAASKQLAGTEGNQNGSDAQPDQAYKQISAMLQHMETMETSYLLDRRIDVTTEALQDLAHFLIAMPGRKNLLWLSGSFPAGILPDGDIGGRDSFEVTRNYSQTLVAVTDLLTIAHVAVYPVDVRGLQTNSMFSAGNNIAFEPGQGKDTRAVRNFSRDQASEHTTMDSIASSTGGHAYYNGNGLAAAEAAAAEEGSLYYTLTYAPANAAYDGKLRHVRVEAKNGDYHLAYRRTYFADNLDAVARKAMDNPDDVLAGALLHGAPASHELFFEAHVEAEGEPIQATDGQMQELVKYEAMATKSKRKALAEVKTPVMLQKYVIQYALLPRQLTMRVDVDSVRRDHLDFAVISYNDDGLTLNGVRTSLEDVIHPDRWSIMLESGYHVPMAVMIPVQARSLRLAVHDVGSNKTGSLELALPLARESAAPAGGR